MEVSSNSGMYSFKRAVLVNGVAANSEAPSNKLETQGGGLCGCGIDTVAVRAQLNRIAHVVYTPFIHVA